jgi:hypothetical protein
MLVRGTENNRFVWILLPCPCMADHTVCSGNESLQWGHDSRKYQAERNGEGGESKSLAEDSGKDEMFPRTVVWQVLFR